MLPCRSLRQLYPGVSPCISQDRKQRRGRVARISSSNPRTTAPAEERLEFHPRKLLNCKYLRTLWHEITNRNQRSADCRVSDQVLELSREIQLMTIGGGS